MARLVDSQRGAARSRQEGATPFVPEGAGLPQLQEAVQHCEGCELYRAATQAVLGEGAATARIVMIGEQPGDQEDLAGRPFVGPAGRLLDRAMEEAGISRRDVYITNAVKHFKFEERGKRRIHKKPSSSEVAACRPWLKAELACIHPEVTVCLGATAAQAVIGKELRVLKDRGRFFDLPTGGLVTATVHPSAVLRSPDAERRGEEYAAFVTDLKKVKEKLDRKARPSSAGAHLL